MLPCELLGKMDRNDLNQRYAECTVEYDSRWNYCNGFDEVYGNTHIYLNDGNKKRFNAKFDWKLLNTERLPSKWYWGLDGERAFFLSYLPTRQWRRGYSRGNCRVWGSAGPVAFTPSVGETFAKQRFETVITPLTTAEDISERMSNDKDLVLGLNFALVNRVGLMFKENAIGSWYKSINRLVMESDVWDDELKEIGMYQFLATQKEKAWAKMAAAAPPRAAQVVLDPFVEQDDHPPRTRAWAMHRVNMFAILRTGDLEQQIREQNRQLRNLMAGRDWDDNG